MSRANLRRAPRFHVWRKLTVTALFPATLAIAAEAPVVVRDCEAIHPLPRPCEAQTEVTTDTSIYFEVTVPIAGHYPTDGVDPDSIVVTLQKTGEPSITIFGPDQVLAADYSGEVVPEFFDSPDYGYGFYIAPDAPLDPLAEYTVSVSGQTVASRTEIDPATGSWSFTTRRDLEGSTLTMAIDLAEPVVSWDGDWFAGEVKPNFNTSRSQHQQGVYELMDEIADGTPGFMAQQRDFPWMSDYWHSLLFDGTPNIVRERETRRILALEDSGTSSRLTLGDLVEGHLYGIAPGRPLSGDYQVDDLVLVCDANRSEVRRVLSIDDANNVIEVERLDTQASQWNPGDPDAAPADDPATPDHFTYPLGALRKYSPHGTPVYYWGRVDDELDQHVAHGRRPQINLFSTPLDLCETAIPHSSNGGVCENRPKSWTEWDLFVRTLIGHFIDRYGEQVLDWTYSIGNEPDLSSFWKDSNEFFDYYDYTSNAMLRAFEQRGLDASRIRIGGVEVGHFHGKINDMLYHCSPTADNPNAGFDEQNAVCFDAAFDGDRAARVETFCNQWSGEGCPLDFISLHTYRPSADAASSIITARTKSLDVDPVAYDELVVDSNETTPDWQGSRDPGWKEVFRWGGFFPTWGADYFRRLLDRAMLDPRHAGGGALITVWPFNYNFVGDSSLAGLMRVDEDADGTMDRVEAVANSFFRFAELTAWMADEVASLPASSDAGVVISGWRSVEPEADRLLLYAHDPQDIEARETAGWDVTLQLSNARFASVAVTEYRIDREHGARAALAALPKRGQAGLYAPAELADLIAESRLAPAGPAVCLEAQQGALDLLHLVPAQGIAYIELARAATPQEISEVVFGADKQTLSWSSSTLDSGPRSVHDVVRGAIDALPVGSGGPETCLANGTNEASLVDPEQPAPGTAYWYLVRGRNVCATGGYGTAAGGAVRETAACSS